MKEKLVNLPHIIWINLEKDKNRKKYMMENLNDYKLQNTRIEGIYNKKSGVLGCFLSHIKALEYFVNNPSIGEYCLITEDDVSFDYLPFWKKTFWDYINDVPKNFNIVQLSVTYGQGELKNNQIIKSIECQKHKYYMWGAACYLIKRDAAKKLLQYIPKLNNKYNIMNIKNAISDVFIYQTIDNVYSIPLFTYNTKFDSNIHQDHINHTHIPSLITIEKLWKNSK